MSEKTRRENAIKGYLLMRDVEKEAEKVPHRWQVRLEMDEMACLVLGRSPSAFNEPTPKTQRAGRVGIQSELRYALWP